MAIVVTAKKYDQHAAIRRGVSRNRTLAAMGHRLVVCALLKRALRLIQNGNERSAYFVLLILLYLAPRYTLGRVKFIQVALRTGRRSGLERFTDPDVFGRCQEKFFHAWRIADLPSDSPSFRTWTLQLMSQAKPLRPYSSCFWEVFGTLLGNEGNWTSSRAAFDHALSLAVTDVRRRQILGNFVDCAGRFGQQSTVGVLTAQIVEAAPEDFESIPRFVDSHSEVDATSEFARKLEDRLLANAARKIDGVHHLHYALSRLNDRSGNCGAAFAHCLTANRLRAEIVGPDNLAALIAHTDLRIRCFTKDWIAAQGHKAAHRYESDDVEFMWVVGMPGSGTGILSKLLWGHSPTATTINSIGISKLTFGGGIGECLGGRRRYPWKTAGMNTSRLADIMSRTRRQLLSLHAGAKRIIVHGAFDFMDLGLICAMFPKTRFIHCTRAPAETCLELFMQDYGDEITLPTTQDGVACLYRQYRRMMNHWQEVLPPGSLVETSFERLMSQPANVISEIRRATGWDAKKMSPEPLPHQAIEDGMREEDMYSVPLRLFSNAADRAKRYQEYLGLFIDLEME